jgi:putative DNA primase/helicase
MSMSDYQNIPDDLQDRDQWLFWNSSSDSPRKPLASPAATSGCSWGDPETWLSFDEARAQAEKVPQAGIGYVNAKDNDEYARGLIGSIDIDGAADEDGHARDWVPSLEPFFDRDAYVEWSPSEQGLRIPVVGIDVPEWWSDFDNIDGEHKGVEVLTNKFSTYTGDTIRGAGEDAVEYGEWLDDWLREVYKELAGEDPLADDSVDTDDDEYTANDEWLTEDAAEEALESINPDCGYDTWKDIGMALVNCFGRSTGGQLFKQWSRGGSKWDSDAKEQAQRIIDDASGYGFDAGTLVMHASSAGWDASEAAREYGDNTRSDGGVSAADVQSADVSTGRDWTLDPLSVLELAVRDPMHPADYDDEGGFEIYPRDLRQNERASYVWTLAKKSGNDDILARRHGPLLAYQPKRSIWNDDDDTRIREIANEALGSAFSGSVVDEVEENIRADPERVKDPNEMGAPDETIMTLDGLLHLRDHDDYDARELEPGKREHHAVANLPLSPDWDAGCPRWQEFIHQSIETEAERLKFQEYCGYTLWRHAQTFGKVMMLVGPTDSGKSTALKVIRHILGDENVASESLQNLVDTRWGRAQLVGNVANIREEVTPSGVEGVEMFKELTGGEASVDAEFKGQKKFDFTVTQKFLFATNEVPSVEDADEAFYNRLLFVRFPDTVPQQDQDPDLDDKLKAESEGILNWMLDGLDRLLEQQGFTGERGINEKKEICDAFGGVIDRFTYNCLMITGNEDDIVSKSDLHDLAHSYAEEIDKDPGWSKQTGFTREMANQRGIGQSTRRINGDPVDVLTGVRVKPEVVYRHNMDLRAKCETHDDTDPQSLDNYREDDIRPGYDTRQERDVIPLILKLIRESDDPRLPHDDLVAQLEEEGVDSSTAETKIEKALHQGDIQEPQTDLYSVV